MFFLFFSSPPAPASGENAGGDGEEKGHIYKKPVRPEYLVARVE